MEETKLDIGSILALGTSFMLISSILYIISLNYFIEIDITKYFNISDYLNYSVKAIVPSVIAFILGGSLSVINSELAKSNDKIGIKHIFVMFIIPLTFLLLYISPSFGWLSKEISRPLMIIVLLFAVLVFDKSILVKIIKIDRHEIIRILLIVIVMASLLGSIDSRQISSDYNHTNKQLFYVNEDEFLEGNLMFVLSEYILIRNNENNILVIPSGNISRIEY